MRKILLSVAPVAADTPFLDPQAVAQDVIACEKNGAAMVHLHCRDARGNLTPDMSLLEETVRLIRKESNIIVEVSTGGVSELTIEERCRPCTPAWVEANSLNVGSVNLGEAVYRNPIRDVRYCVQQILRNGKLAETELFEVGMANTLRELDLEYHFPRPLLIALVLGHAGAMPATEAALRHMVQGVQENFPAQDVLWGYTQAHREDWSLCERALDMGASALRIGFEDSDLLAPAVRARNNAELIAAAAAMLQRKGFAPMTAAEARAMLRFPPPRC